MSLRPSAIWRSSSMDSSRLRRSAPYRIAVPWSALVEQLIFGAHIPPYRMQVRLRQALAAFRMISLA
jgi:hypothetical protein